MPLERTLAPLVASVAVLVALISAGCDEVDTTEPICLYDPDNQTFACDDTTIEVSDGEPGDEGTSCEAAENEDGSVDVTCDDGTTFTVEDGEDGRGCTVLTNADGSLTITCDDGTEAIVEPGEDGDSCTVAEVDGVVTLSCDDGSGAVVEDGDDGGSCSVSDTEGGLTITCDDGSEVTVEDGEEGVGCVTSEDEESGDITITCAEGTVVIEGRGDSTLVGLATLLGRIDHTGILVTLVGDAGVVDTALTDANGNYSFADVPVGNYDLDYVFEGYNDAELNGVIAVPGTVFLPDVVLDFDDLTKPAGSVFIVDVCSSEEGTATGILWLEDYTILDATLFGGFGFPGAIFVPPGVNPLPLVAFGTPAIWYPGSGETDVLGDLALSTNVFCSPDGSAVMWQEPASVEDVFASIFGEGLPDIELVLWDVAARARNVVADQVLPCGSIWSPTSDAVAFLRFPEGFDEDRGNGGEFTTYGQLNVYDDELHALANNVGCELPGLGGQFGFPLFEPSLFATVPHYEFSPNGESIRWVDDAFRQLSVFRLADEALWFLTQNTSWDPGLYSPGGDRLAYTYFDPGEPAGSPPSGWVVEVNYVSSSSDGNPDVAQVTDQGTGDKRLIWSPDDQYLGYQDDGFFDSKFFGWFGELRLFDANGRSTLPDVLAFDMPYFPVDFEPNSEFVLFAANEPNFGNPEATGVGAGSPNRGFLVRWEIDASEPEFLSGDTRTDELQALYSPDGESVAFIEWPGSLLLWEDPTGVRGEPLRTNTFAFFDIFAAVWGPDSNSLVTFETNTSELTLINVTIDDATELTSGRPAIELPVQYNPSGETLLVYGVPEDGGIVDGFPPLFVFLPSLELSEWTVSDLSQTIITEDALFGGYTLDGNSALVIDSVTQTLAPKGATARWDVGGGSVEMAPSVDLLSNFALVNNDAAWVVRSLSFPELLENGVHYAILP